MVVLIRVGLAILKIAGSNSASDEGKQGRRQPSPIVVYQKRNVAIVLGFILYCKDGVLKSCF